MLFKRIPVEERKEAAEKARSEVQDYFSSDEFIAKKKSRQLRAICLLVVGLPIIGVAALLKLNPQIMLAVAFSAGGLVFVIVQYVMNRKSK